MVKFTNYLCTITPDYGDKTVSVSGGGEPNWWLWVEDYAIGWGVYVFGPDEISEIEEVYSTIFVEEL